MGYGGWLLVSLTTWSEPGTITTGTNQIVRALAGQLALYGFVLGAAFSAPAALLLATGVLQLRRGLGHVASIAAAIATGSVLTTAAWIPRSGVLRDGMTIGVISGLFCLHLVALMLAWLHAERRRPNEGPRG